MGKKVTNRKFAYVTSKTYFVYNLIHLDQLGTPYLAGIGAFPKAQTPYLGLET